MTNRASESGGGPAATRSAVAEDRLELGLGLLSIGRSWGVANNAPPGEAESAALMELALDSGIRVFDTAPAYAASEARLGRFLDDLEPSRRADLVILTKAGEHWDERRGVSFVDHGRDALIRSIDRSLELLGRIDLLQIHKATRAVVEHPDVIAALLHAEGCGIRRFGASVSDLEAGLAALATGRYCALQFPLNATNETMLPLLPAIEHANGIAIVNRPFAMGHLISQHGGTGDQACAAFRYIRKHVREGLVLTGTGNPRHLAANIEAFRIVAGAEVPADRPR